MKIIIESTNSVGYKATVEIPNDDPELAQCVSMICRVLLGYGVSGPSVKFLEMLAENTDVLLKQWEVQPSNLGSIQTVAEKYKKPGIFGAAVEAVKNAITP